MNSGSAAGRLRQMRALGVGRQIVAELSAEYGDAWPNEALGLLLARDLEHQDYHAQQDRGLRAIAGFVGAVVTGVGSNIDRIARLIT